MFGIRIEGVSRRGSWVEVNDIKRHSEEGKTVHEQQRKK
jgi:hypothetical protein